MDDRIYQWGYDPGETGVIEDKPDERDYKFSAAGAMPIDWEKGFEVKAPIIIRNQKRSLSCVGQSFATYKGVLDFLDTGNPFLLSPKSLYALIYIDQGGAYLREGAKMAVSRGINLESSVPSQMLDGDVSEVFMRDFSPNEALDKEAGIFAGKAYYSVDCRMETLAAAVLAGNGLVLAVKGSNLGWSGADVRPPLPEEYGWQHAIYVCGFGMRNGKKALKFANSWGQRWGEDGYGYLSEDYFINNGEFVFPGWVLLDKPNVEKNNMIQVLKERNSPDIFLVYDNKKVLIPGPVTFDQLGKPEFVEVDKIDAEFVGSMLISTEDVRQ